MQLREAFSSTFLKWCHTFIKMRKTGNGPDPFHLFLTGGAGTGKSHVVTAVYQLFMKQMPGHGDDPDAPAVLLTAPTGTAAFQIGGTTLHSAFLLPLPLATTWPNKGLPETLR